MPNGFGPGLRKDVDSRGDEEKDVDSRGEIDKDVDSRGGAAGTGGGLFGVGVPPALIATDLFGRAAALGGVLRVSIEAPIPACPKPGNKVRAAGSMRNVAAAAERRDALDVQKLQDQKKTIDDLKKIAEQQQRMITELLEALKRKPPAAS